MSVYEAPRGYIDGQFQKKEGYRFDGNISDFEVALQVQRFSRTALMFLDAQQRAKVGRGDTIIVSTPTGESIPLLALAACAISYDMLERFCHEKNTTPVDFLTANLLPVDGPNVASSAKSYVELGQALRTRFVENKIAPELFPADSGAVPIRYILNRIGR